MELKQPDIKNFSELKLEACLLIHEVLVREALRIQREEQAALREKQLNES